MGQKLEKKIVVAPEIPFTAIAAIADEIPSFMMSLVIAPNRLNSVVFIVFRKEMF
ncbi:hypothetical protein P7M41_20140 [Vibrio parahaemolyticus]|nr:hypothetical protein [Vibrio parahaemolyticus]MDF4263822.1 hypothetical protein [Vibrio parahaemolyticus]MDF4325676.1 hypothetical protein [Vibrio parahaemolyticus]MDG2554343.1 hypothetical protein [Vibrio parahaemolyticus]